MADKSKNDAPYKNTCSRPKYHVDPSHMHFYQKKRKQGMKMTQTKMSNIWAKLMPFKTTHKMKFPSMLKL
jgi:hypothetical protein